MIVTWTSASLNHLHSEDSVAILLLSWKDEKQPAKIRKKHLQSCKVAEVTRQEYRHELDMEITRSFKLHIYVYQNKHVNVMG